MPIAPLMQRFVDDELARSDDLIARTRAGTLQLLRDPSGLAATERALQFELADALQRQAPRFDAEFIDTLRRLVADEMAIRVVDGLEPVHVDHEAGQPRVLGVGAARLELEPGVQAVPIEETRQHVEAGGSG